MLVPLLLILRQPDLGTALLLLIVFMPMIFLAGLKLWVLLASIVLGLCSLPVAWHFVLKPYQQERVLTFLDPTRDPLGAGYHIIQSKIAVGNGGIWGQRYWGWNSGTAELFASSPHRLYFLCVCRRMGLCRNSDSPTTVHGIDLLVTWAHPQYSGSGQCDADCRRGHDSDLACTDQHRHDHRTHARCPEYLPFFSYGGSAMLSQMFGIGLLLNVRMRRFRTDEL